MKAFFDSSALVTNPDALRDRFDRDGYIYIPGLLDTQPLLDLRRQIVDICADCNWLKPDTNSMDAISWTVPKVEGEEEYFEVYDRVQRLQDFHALPHQPAMMEVMKILLGGSAFPHPLSIARLVFPDNQAWSTPPHQDFVNNQGTQDLYALWIPLSDCPTSMGSLAFLEGSHKLGLLPLEYSLGDGHRQTSLSPECNSLNWLASDFKLGDLVIFHSLSIHRALPNQSDRMRISVDYRYQAEGQDMTKNCLVTHCDRQPWSKIYEGWDREDLKYYWKNKQVNFVPWNHDYGKLPDGHMATAVKLNQGYNRSREALVKKYGKHDS